MADLKNAIDKTEELARKIWLAGLGAYGHGLNNAQGGYDKMNDQTRRFFDDLVDQGTKIEADAKGALDKTGDKLKEQGQKLKDQGKKLKAQGKNIREEGFNLNVSARVEEIREKVASKLTMPTLPSFSNDDKLAEMNTKLEKLIDVVAKLSAEPKTATATETEEKPAPKKKAPARKAVPKKNEAAA
ncbi:MAG: phasin family protein [Porticoccus sp.]|nr:phasin family protein [Porticoccus sp.]MBQ0806812.1 phasin family protein [Porticoccus sp.]